ncbi:MAG: hypothetical protein H0T42_04390, partial [Deltaproteobacteria bacterium]|nr:hypothetical protein [Deltaproteobacteria bacterium]
MVRAFIAGSILYAGACVGFTDDSDLGDTESRSDVQTPYLPGNPTCADLGYAHELKVDSPPIGVEQTYPLAGGATLKFTFTNSKTMNWSSTIGIDAVLMKAGDGAFNYAYNPESFGANGLITPNNNGGQQADISHVNFCYDLDVLVSKTASTSWTRSHDWTIQKSAAQTNLLLSFNQVYDLLFNVVVSSTSSDSGWGVGGTITVTNPDPTFDAVLSSVTDSMTNFGDIALDCGAGVTWPVTLSPLETLSCTYTAAPADGSARQNTATATAAAGSMVGSATVTVPVTFSSTPTTTVDGCVTVTDTQVPGGLGEVCASQGTKTFTYPISINSSVCGPTTLTNTAAYSSTSGETGSSTVNVSIDIACVTGCTLT